MLGTSSVDLKNLCRFTCRNISADEIFITQLTPSYYAVTNLPRTASLRCYSSQIYTSINLMNDSKIIQSTHPPGSFLIHLHCFCTAIISPSIQLYPDVLCKDEEQLSIMPPVHVLIPSRWSTISHPVIAISTLETASITYLSKSILASSFKKYPRWSWYQLYYTYFSNYTGTDGSSCDLPLFISTLPWILLEYILDPNALLAVGKTLQHVHTTLWPPLFIISLT